MNSSIANKYMYDCLLRMKCNIYRFAFSFESPIEFWKGKKKVVDDNGNTYEAELTKATENEIFERLYAK